MWFKVTQIKMYMPLNEWKYRLVIIIGKFTFENYYLLTEHMHIIDVIYFLVYSQRNLYKSATKHILNCTHSTLFNIKQTEVQ